MLRAAAMLARLFAPTAIVIGALVACAAAPPAAQTFVEPTTPALVGGELVWRGEALDAPREGAVAWLVDEEGPFAEARVARVEPIATGLSEGNTTPTAYRFVVAPVRALRGALPETALAIAIVGPWEAAARARRVPPQAAASFALPAGAPSARLASLVLDRDGDGVPDRIVLDRVPTHGPARPAGGIFCYDTCRVALERGRDGWAVVSRRCIPACQAITY
jgi:hypothetical protein